ncbi:hypothetical protein [Desulfovibrio inopinatus]|uniref:hypothetical protein n=1 Tax=Desulfovibrio inopinatus TaxID=102109 RepID=UPI000418987A|nr:hypothetical protein [Desulfovibrio inopinatus]
MKNVSTGWAVSTALGLLMVLTLGLGLVWLNIERVDLAYRLKKTRNEIEWAEGLAAKLEVERDTLSTPSRLRRMAENYGLGPAMPGQIRQLRDTPISAGALSENDLNASSGPQVRKSVDSRN